MVIPLNWTIDNVGSLFNQLIRPDWFLKHWTYAHQHLHTSQTTTELSSYHLNKWTVDNVNSWFNQLVSKTVRPSAPLVLLQKPLTNHKLSFGNSSWHSSRHLSQFIPIPVIYTSSNPNFIQVVSKPHRPC